MAKHRFRDLPLQIKMTLVYILSSFLILAVNTSLLIGITTVSARLQRTYEDNLYLNDLSNALSDVQVSMTEYLNVKSSDALEYYYINDQKYRNLIQNLNIDVTDSSYDRFSRCFGYPSFYPVLN